MNVIRDFETNELNEKGMQLKYFIINYEKLLTLTKMMPNGSARSTALALIRSYLEDYNNACLAIYDLKLTQPVNDLKLKNTLVGNLLDVICESMKLVEMGED